MQMRVDEALIAPVRTGGMVYRRHLPTRQGSEAGRTCDRVQVIGLGDALNALTPGPSPTCTGEGRAEA